MAGTTSLVNQFDDIVAATGVLCAGAEGGERSDFLVAYCINKWLSALEIYLLNVFLLTAFAEFLAHQISIHMRAQEMVEENTKLKVN